MTAPVTQRTPRYMPPLDAWNDAALPPSTTLGGGALLASLVPYAILAPSSHNTQPWRFTLVGDELLLHADRTRALRVADPQHRELTISCGAALGTLRIAARAAGRTLDVARLPDDRDPDLLARIAVGDRVEVLPRDVALFDAIPRRHTTRTRYVRAAIAPLVLGDLVERAREDGATLEFLDEEAPREAFATLVGEGDRLQAGDAEFRRELAEWLHPNRTSHRDGMPGYAFGLGSVASTIGPWVMRAVDWGDAQAARDRDYALGAPAVAILAAPSDAPVDWLRTGEALARVTLAATAHGLRHAYLNQPMQLPTLRSRATALLRTGGVPQLGLRFGVGTEVLPTPRRPVGEVLRVVAAPPMRAAGAPS
ncbi:MAG: hypothetical protein MUF21_10270 [Gemmatimonadaceae bacterium]|nr:hypothetical protein [Gemmatimonadaceae bacterium]